LSGPKEDASLHPRFDQQVLLTNIRAARIDSTGALLDPAGISIGSAADAGARTIAWNGAQFVVLWSDGSGSH
jgi:hypothetical protein